MTFLTLLSVLYISIHEFMHTDAHIHAPMGVNTHTHILVTKIIKHRSGHKVQELAETNSQRL